VTILVRCSQLRLDWVAHALGLELHEATFENPATREWFIVVYRDDPKRVAAFTFGKDDFVEDEPTIWEFLRRGFNACLAALTPA
jgi:hypothetical protein